jgi:branched-chain amino acid transport system substrate-binding protein
VKGAILVALLIISIFAGCIGGPSKEVAPVETSPAPTEKPVEKGPSEIKIGIVAPLTGKASTTGNDMWEAAQLAAEEINAKGGVYVAEYDRKIPIKLYAGDTETNPEKGVQAVTRLIQDDEVNILVGGFSSAITYADQVIAAEEEVPFVITGASTPLVTTRTDIDTSYFFHHCPTTNDFAYATMKFANDVVRPAINEKFGFPEDRKLRVALIYQDSKYGKGVYDGVMKALEENPDWKIEIVAAETFKMGETNFQTVLTKVKAAKPDVVYPATFLNEQVPLVTQGRRDVGLNTIYFSVECNDDPDYYTGVGEWGEYSIQESRFSPYSLPSGDIRASVEKFRESFKEKFGEYPSMMGASTYEGVYIAAAAIEKAGSLKNTEIRKALNDLQLDQMVEAMQGGVIDFSEDTRESKFQLYMQQLFIDETTGELRPKIVWPDNLKETDFVLPDWYEPGGE